MAEKTGPSQPKRTRLKVGGIIGNALEWYDFTVYGFFAAILGRLFFPHESAAVSLIAAFGVYAAGFLIRPLGAVIFGYVGDLIGRKRVLTITIAVMAVPTTLMGCLPTYAEIGIAAPILLALLRIVQGLSVSGELIGSIVYLIEDGPKDRR
ncbi:MAG: MFS transporter, partial [Alphaproteobacteria bacterium]|nr:MFS transporter [Alphaproteobacteria bacterium]